MKPKTMILMGLAIVCGLGASYMTSRLLAERQPQEEEKIEILVAKKPLSVGERIINPDDFFERKAVAKTDEPPDAIKDLEALKGKVMKQSRNRGDHVTTANLLDKNRLDIPEGHQAVGLPVNLATTAHGLATLPNSRVDLILTVKNAGDINNTFSKKVLQNVLVLAADGRVNPDGEIIAPASVVTLALTPKEALIANTAKEMGTLTLSLRKLDDPAKNDLAMIDGREVLYGPKKMLDPRPAKIVELPRASEAKEGTPGRLDINNGGTVRSIRYRVLDNGDIEYDNPPGAAAQPRVQPQPQPGISGKGPAQDF